MHREEILEITGSIGAQAQALGLDRIGGLLHSRIVAGLPVLAQLPEQRAKKPAPSPSTAPGGRRH